MKSTIKTSRLARSTKDLLEIVEQLQAKGVHLVSNKENLDTGTPTGKLMLTMIAAIERVRASKSTGPPTGGYRHC